MVLHLLLELFPFFEEDVKCLRQNTHCHRIIVRLNEGADSLSCNDSFCVLRIILHFFQYILFLQDSHFFHLHSFVSNLSSFNVKLTLTDQCVWTQIVADHVRRIQAIEIQDTDGLIEIHSNLGR